LIKAMNTIKSDMQSNLINSVLQTVSNTNFYNSLLFH